MPKKVDTTYFRDLAESIASKTNIKRYEFPPKEIEKVLITYSKKNPNDKMDFKELPLFAAGFCNENDTDYEMVNAIIELTKKYHKEEMVVVTKSKGKKVLIIGETSIELFNNINLKWDEGHFTTTMAKIPLTFNIHKKMKCYKGESILDEINRQKEKKNKIKVKTTKKSVKKTVKKGKI